MAKVHFHDCLSSVTLNYYPSEGQGREGIQEKTVMTIKKNGKLVTPVTTL